MLHAHPHRKNLWLWALFDFANSLAFVNVSFYFGLWFVSEHEASDVWMSASLALTTVIMLLVLPVIGKMSDHVRRRMPFLRACTILSIFLLIALGVFMQSTGEVLSRGETVIIFILYSLFSLFYLSSFAFYDAFLQDITSEHGSLEKTSGLGMGMGQIGNIVGLLVAFPLAGGAIPLLGMRSTPAVFVFAAVLFLLFSLPTLLFLKESSASHESVKLGRNFRETLRDLRHLRSSPGVLPYLLTYALFADALLTLQLFASLYLDVVGKLDATQKNSTFLIALFFGIVGSFVSPLFVRMFGSSKRAITACIALWALVLGAIAFSTSPPLFMTFIILNGFAFGALFSLSRAFYSALVPREKQAQMFGIYALFERTASIIGPLLWSFVAFLFASFGEDRYRFSVLSLAALIVISLIVFQYVRDPRRSESTDGARAPLEPHL